MRLKTRKVHSFFWFGRFMGSTAAKRLTSHETGEMETKYGTVQRSISYRELQNLPSKEEF
jgi:hypothetical protein